MIGYVFLRGKIKPSVLVRSAIIGLNFSAKLISPRRNSATFDTHGQLGYQFLHERKHNFSVKKYVSYLIGLCILNFKLFKFDWMNLSAVKLAQFLLGKIV